jgi:hypothetical protein
MPGGALLNADKMPAEDQRAIAKTYLSAFFAATLQSNTSYMPLFSDYAAGAAFLPDTTDYVNRYKDASFTTVATFDEDVQMTKVGGGKATWTGDAFSWAEEPLLDRSGNKKGTKGLTVAWGQSAVTEAEEATEGETGDNRAPSSAAEDNKAEGSALADGINNKANTEADADTTKQTNEASNGAATQGNREGVASEQVDVTGLRAGYTVTISPELRRELAGYAMQGEPRATLTFAAADLSHMGEPTGVEDEERISGKLTIDVRYMDGTETTLKSLASISPPPHSQFTLFDWMDAEVSDGKYEVATESVLETIHFALPKPAQEIYTITFTVEAQAATGKYMVDDIGFTM